MYVCMYVCTRWRLLDRTLWWTNVKPVRFTLSFAFCLLFRQARATQQHRNCADESKGCSAKFVPTTCEIRRKIGRKSTKNRAKSSKNHSRAVLGAQGRFGDTPGRARDGLWTAKCRPKADLEAPRAGRERPRYVQKCSWTAPQTLPDRPGAAFDRVWSSGHHRTRSRSDFSSILRRCA